ncbi:recombinational DNA repair ATPase RecF [Haloferula luteola]|uniref:Recombinational DNA repair ATPase RecF n=1 Tax=Haloferula luteola TaxID=595692 RepID=A0A840V292_9BACT|nr:AAA family ATPase [Haloferula luteola]MBB5352105.1 recombinational DNA repair ATPase RecF [Haloferula luteola]
MKLSLEAFRGVDSPFEIRFDTKQNLTVLYGENGSGKTTISDAFEFVIDGTAGSLEEKSLDGKSKLGQLVNACRKAVDLRVSLEVAGQTRSARLARQKVQLDGRLAYRLKVLSRKNITKLVEETPANRFKRIQDFVSIPALDREEAALNELVLSEQRNLESQSKLIAQAGEMLSALFEEHADKAKYGSRQDQWQRDLLQDSAETIAENFQMLDDLNQQIKRLRDDFKPLADSYPAVAKAQEAVKKEEAALAKLIADHSDDLAKAFETLQQARGFLRESGTGICPVCDSEIGHAALVEKVDQKLEALKAVKDQSQKAKNTKEALHAAQTSQKTLQQSFLSILIKLREVHQAAVDSEQWQLPDLVPSVLGMENAEDLTEGWFAGLKAEAPQLKPLSETVEREHAALQIRRKLQSDVRGALNRIKSAKGDGKRMEFSITRGEAIKKVLHDERIRHANETLKAISGDFAQLYARIHDGEKIETIQLYLHPNKKSSAQFDGTLFGKKEASPVALLSESHLDTLGLCLFLALEKRENPGNTILFLDDAIASVDDAHMERLYELLLEESAHFHHVVISSHYQPLRFKFRWGILTQNKVEFLELGRWTLDSGLSLKRGPSSEVSFLRRYVREAEHPSAIANTAGLVLENILDFLTGIYQCRLPRSPGAEQRWTLNDYRSGLAGEKKLLPALRCEHLDEQGTVTRPIPLAPLLEDVFSRLQIRNAIGCHFKELAGHFDELAEALALGNATLALAEALCDERDTLPDRKKDGCSWHNRGGTVTRRLYPLHKPE